MNLLIRFTMLACLLTISCSSVQTYFINRGNDALDIVNVGVEKNIYGVRIKIFVPIGYQKANSGVGYGLRKGYLGKYFIGDPENKISIQNNEDEAKNLPVEYEILLGDTDFTSIKSHS